MVDELDEIPTPDGESEPSDDAFEMSAVDDDKSDADVAHDDGDESDESEPG